MKHKDDLNLSDRTDAEMELMLHEMFMHDLLDDLGAPRYPDNDETRPPYGTYGRLRAYADSIGVKASMWEGKNESSY